MPSFVKMTGPGEAVITDDAAVEIAKQTTIIAAAITTAVNDLKGIPGTGSASPGTFEDIANKLDLIAKHLIAIAGTSDTLSKAVVDIKAKQSALVSLQQESNIMQAMAVCDQMDTNRTQTQISYEALDRAGIPRPKLPPILDIFKETLEKYKTFNLMVETEGLIKSGTDKLTGLVKVQMTAFDDAFGITAFLKEKAEVLKTALLPSTRGAQAAIESKTKVVHA